MTKRPRVRGGLFAAFLAALWAFPSVLAAADKKIMILRSGDYPIYDFAAKGFTEGLSLHKVPFVLEEKTLPKDEGEIDVFMQGLRAHPPDLVFTVGTMATRVLHENGGTIPFVYAMIVDPPSLGIVTGGAVMEVSPELQLDFIRTHFPKMRKVGVIYSGERNREAVRILQNSKVPGLTLDMIQAETPEDVSKAILRLSKEADCLLMVSDAILYSPQTATQVILQTIQNGLPIIAVSPNFVKVGALAAVYPDYKDNGLLAADVASRFFNGEPLENIPTLWAAHTHIAVNLVVAHYLRISIPEKLVELAEEVTR